MTARRVRGFTLIEIIITLVLMGIAAAMVSTFATRGITQASAPMAYLQTDVGLQLVMENMIQDYANFKSNLPGFTKKIGTPGTYAITGTSYSVSVNKYVKLSGTSFVDDPSGTAYLLVTIKPSSSSGVSLSYLFSSQ